MLKVKDIAEHLHKGNNKAYALVRMKGFPKIKIGNTYIIPEERYKKWLDEHIKNEIKL
jgi:hypothetical protein